MNPNELKAMLKKTNEVAAYPLHIEAEIPYHLETTRRRRKPWQQIYCPTGLFRAIVIEDGHKWVEKRPISQCDTHDYEIERRNGVLVEFSLKDMLERNPNLRVNMPRLYGKDSKSPYPHTTVGCDEKGEMTVQMIISRKLVFSDWTSYTLIEAQRQKETEEQEARERALRDPQAAIMGMTPDEFQKTYIVNTPDRSTYLDASWTVYYKFDKKSGLYVKDKSGKTIKAGEVGKIEITIERANEILNALREIAMLAHVEDEPGSPTEQIRIVLEDLLPLINNESDN